MRASVCVLYRQVGEEEEVVGVIEGQERRMGIYSCDGTITIIQPFSLRASTRMC